MKIENITNFGERLKKLREMRGLTRRELALKVGVSEMTIRRWEKNITSPKLKDLRALSNSLGVSEEFLTGGPSMLGATNSIKMRIDRLPEKALEELNIVIDYLLVKYSKKKKKDES